MASSDNVVASSMPSAVGESKTELGAVLRLSPFFRPLQSLLRRCFDAHPAIMTQIHPKPTDQPSTHAPVSFDRFRSSPTDDRRRQFGFCPPRTFPLTAPLVTDMYCQLHSGVDEQIATLQVFSPLPTWR